MITLQQINIYYIQKIQNAIESLHGAANHIKQYLADMLGELEREHKSVS